MRFIAALQPFTVEVLGGLHRVRRPSVADALLAYAVMSTGEWSLLSGWLPHRLLDILHRLPATESARVMRLILSSGVDLDDKKSAEDRAASDSWEFVLSLYAKTFGIAPSVALSEPWPLFVSMLTQVDRLTAQDQMHSVGWYASAKGGDVSRIVARATGEKPVEFEEPEIMSDPEWLARQHETIRRLRQKQAHA